MYRAAWPIAALLLATAVSGCLGARGGDAPSDAATLPPGWDEESPDRSALASVPFYELRHSTTFLLKGHEYGRYIVYVPESLDGTRLFFTTGQVQDGYTTSPHAPVLRGPDPDADEYHFEFLQVRPLGRELQTSNVDARSEFGFADAPGTYTLTYLYGKGTNHPFLAPFGGDPYDWRFEAGYYEFVLATDEALTVGINVHTGSDYWDTLYHPQELGLARAESLQYRATVLNSVGGKIPDVDLAQGDLLRARAGERLNYFAFADVWYETGGFAMDAAGLAIVAVNGRETPHRLAVTSPGPADAEAYAFAVHFNAPGPLRETVNVRGVFHEAVSAQSTVGVLAFIFAVAVEPTQTHPGVAGLAS